MGDSLLETRVHTVHRNQL